MMDRLFAIALGLVTFVSADYTVSVSHTSPFSLVVKSGQEVITNNVAVLAGQTNSSAGPITASDSGTIANHGGQITWDLIRPRVVKFQINSSSSFLGAQFEVEEDDLFYGVWEYPWSDSITNTNVSFDLKAVGNSDGVNWSNARAPFFITNGGCGVYADTLDMGSFDFTTPGQAQFIFNTSSLTYYVILPKSKYDYKSIIEEYIALSAPIEMPPDSGYGPAFWSDDFTQDFHGSVSNAQENYYDVVNHLYYNRIHASSMFADRKS